jgi:hypothetical protein
MIIKCLITLVIAMTALAEESANLRGAQPVEHSHGFANQQSNLEKQETALKLLLKNKMDPAVTAEKVAAQKAAEKATTESGPKALDYNGGNPGLTFDGYMVSRFHSNPDCTGPGTFPFSNFTSRSSSVLFAHVFHLCLTLRVLLQSSFFLLQCNPSSRRVWAAGTLAVIPAYSPSATLWSTAVAVNRDVFLGDPRWC